MLQIGITATRPGRWRAGTRNSAWSRILPASWVEVPDDCRAKYYTWLVADEEAGLLAVLRHLLHLPDWALSAISPDDTRAIIGLLSWMRPTADCKSIPFPSFQHRGITYHFPKPKGSNVTCLEYPLADEYYLRFYHSAQGDAEALLLLVATICRESEPDHAAAARRGDPRVPLNSRAEIEARALRLAGLPAYMQFAALLYFAGLKEYVYNTYKAWIFEEEDVDDPEAETPDEDDDEDEYEAAPEQAPARASGPDFGWWGIFQDAAEAGLFGTLDDVYHTSLHNVAMWLVRQRVRADAQRQQFSTIKTSRHDDI